jgi:hypothetical protein
VMANWQKRQIEKICFRLIHHIVLSSLTIIMDSLRFQDPNFVCYNLIGFYSFSHK